MANLLNWSGMMDEYFSSLHIPKNIMWTDIVEIIIISFLVYQVLMWIRNTRAWSLLKGVLIILAFLLLAVIFQLTTILWIAEKMFSIAVIAIVVILQPELRRALERLGQKRFAFSFLMFDNAKEENGRFSDKTLNEIVKASMEMGKAKTGALIVIEKETSLAEYERTGIEIDAVLTNQLLINIFEHNTPLHDGAVIVRGNRVTWATCYLPLSDSMSLSKDLGTRHRAGVGISEVTDSMTVIVSEETGRISVAYEGNLRRNLDAESLREQLRMIQNKGPDSRRKRRIWKGRGKNAGRKKTV
jgi:diadenylate cyclase